MKNSSINRYTCRKAFIVPAMQNMTQNKLTDEQDPKCMPSPDLNLSPSQPLQGGAAILAVHGKSWI
jgi:hypothetical protein